MSRKKKKEIKNLVFTPDPDLEKKLKKAGLEAKFILEQEEKNRRRSPAVVMRKLVRSK